jgi:hypothetical protein
MSTSTTPAAPGAVAPHFEAAYLRLMPTLLRVARHHFRHVGCPDRRHDLICEVLALCWLWHGRLAAKGRDPAEFATVFAATAAKAVNSGRRLCGCEKARDALSPACQRRRGFTVSPLPSGSAMIGNDFDEALRDNTQTPIPDQVQFRIDFPRWADGLPAQKRTVLERLAGGEKTQEVAAAVGLTPARVSQLRREFHDDYAAFCEGAAT